MEDNTIKRAAEIVSAGHLDCVLALIDVDGYPTASTITVSKCDGIKWLTFCTGLGADRPNSKAKRIAKCNRASVCFFSLSPLYNITLVGTIEVITDPDIKKEMWYEGLENHFKGPEDPNYCVLKFTTERHNLVIV